MCAPLRRLSFALLFLPLISTLTPPGTAQERARDDPHQTDYTSEFIGRSWAIEQVLPAYPPEALARDLQGVVEVFVGITDEGKVLKVRVPPGRDPLLQQAAVAAARQWRFREWVNKMEPGGYCVFRLTFNFIIEEGAGRVELYNPPYDTPQHRRMRGASYRDVKEWLAWADATHDN